MTIALTATPRAWGSQWLRVPGMAAASSVKLASLAITIPAILGGLATKASIEAIQRKELSDGALSKFNAFAELCRKAFKRIVDIERRVLLGRPEKLTQIGAWRAAGRLMREKRPVEAARLWMTNPFNPDWTVLLVKGQVEGSKKKRQPFHLALMASVKAIHGDASLEWDYCQKVVHAMSVAKEVNAVGSISAPVVHDAAPSARRARL